MTHLARFEFFCEENFCSLYYFSDFNYQAIKLVSNFDFLKLIVYILFFQGC